LFVASVLAFCCGIYLEAFYGVRLAPLLLAALAVTAALPFVARSSKAFALLLLAGFMLCGGARLAFIDLGRTAPEEDGSGQVYEGTVVESAAHLKVLALSAPSRLAGMRVVFFSNLDLPLSDRVRVFGALRPVVPGFKNPGSLSWKWLKRLEGVSYEVRGRVLSAVHGSDPIASMRRYFKENIERSGAPEADILKALTIGDRAAIPQEKNDLFLHTGTSHILAISGFNVGVISGFFFFIARAALRRIRRFRMSGKDRRYAALITIPFPLVFMLVAGAGVSVIRAAIMIAVFMLAIFLERERDFYNTAALAALAILLAYPHSLLTPSFQLTFMSLIFIVMLMRRTLPALARIKNRVALWSLSTVVSTAAATLGTTPIVLYYFYGINPFSVLHNLVTIPIMGVAATLLGLVGMTTHYGWPLLLAAGKITGVNLALLHALDFGYLYPLIRPSLSEMALYYAVLIALVHLNRRHVPALLICVLLPLSAVQAYADYRQRFNTDLGVFFIDVGQGNAALVEGPGGLRVLIDGGGYPNSDFDMGRQVIAPFLLYRKIRTIDYVVNTHPHADHTGGLPYVLRNFHVSRLVTGGLYPREQKSRELLEAAAAMGVERLIWKKGDGLLSGAFRMDVLHPGGPVAWDDPNNSALVLRIRHGEKAFLLPADIESNVEEKMVFSGLPLRSDVLEVPHHGSAASSSLPFIAAVRPGLAVVSVAGGHIKNLPSDEALGRYAALSIPVLRTDRQGCIEVRSDGRRITWRMYGGK
jgi:competence protein ComEC